MDGVPLLVEELIKAVHKTGTDGTDLPSWV
jgi:hypothetical protein